MPSRWQIIYSSCRKYWLGEVCMYVGPVSACTVVCVPRTAVVSIHLGESESCDRRADYWLMRCLLFGTPRMRKGGRSHCSTRLREQTMNRLPLPVATRCAVIVKHR